MSAIPIPLRDRVAAPPADAPARPALRVVERRQRRVQLLALTGMLAIVGSLFALVAFNSALAQGEFHVSRLDRDLEAAQLRNERLRLEVAERGSPSSVVRAARKLGLVVPTDIEYVVAPEAVKGHAPIDQTSATLAHTFLDTKADLAPGR